jgi:hypothetical protein
MLVQLGKFAGEEGLQCTGRESQVRISLHHDSKNDNELCRRVVGRCVCVFVRLSFGVLIGQPVSWDFLFLLFIHFLIALDFRGLRPQIPGANESQFASRFVCAARRWPAPPERSLCNSFGRKHETINFSIER